MALSHILSAITEETDATIAALTAVHSHAVQEMSNTHEHTVGTIRSRMNQQKNERLHQLRKRAEDHVSMMRRHSVLRRKQELLDEFFAKVMKELSALPATETERILTVWVTKLPRGGTIIPSKNHETILKKLIGERVMAPATEGAGGFRFVSDKEDRDCTYEFLVKNILRPNTEIEVAGQLFGSSR